MKEDHAERRGFVLEELGTKEGLERQRHFVAQWCLDPTMSPFLFSQHGTAQCAYGCMGLLHLVQLAVT